MGIDRRESGVDAALRDAREPQRQRMDFRPATISGAISRSRSRKRLRPGDPRALEAVPGRCPDRAPLQVAPSPAAASNNASSTGAKIPAAIGRPSSTIAATDRPVRPSGEIGARAVDRVDDENALAPAVSRSSLAFLRKPAEAGAATIFRAAARRPRYRPRRPANRCPWSRSAISPRKVFSASAPASRNASPRCAPAPRAISLRRQWPAMVSPSTRKVGALVP